MYALSDSGDIASTPRLLFKSETPGALRLYGRTGPRTIRLMDVQRGSNKVLDELEWSAKGTAIEITSRPTQQAYWMAAEW